MNGTKENLGVVVPALLAPGAATALVVGIVGLGLFKLFSDDEEDEGFLGIGSPARPNQTAPSITPTVADLPTDGFATELTLAEEPLELESETVAEPLSSVTGDEETQPATDVNHRETIRHYMSELGKRSAAARARKAALQREAQLE